MVAEALFAVGSAGAGCEGPFESGCDEGRVVDPCCAFALLTVRHIQTALKRKKGHFFMGAKVKYPIRVKPGSHKVTIS